MYATQIAVKFRTAPHYCKTNLFSLWKHIVFSLFSLSKNWMHNVVWGCAEILPKSLKSLLNVKSTRIILNFSNWVESAWDLGWHNQLNTLSGIVKQTKLFYLLFGLENMRNNLGYSNEHELCCGDHTRYDHPKCDHSNQAWKDANRAIIRLCALSL